MDEVLAGRAAVDVHQLVALIHSVNPTGRGLGPREQARAYATKSALQSLLVRRFFEHVGVTESAPGVVALSLRETGELAAHCPIDELEEDARARVRFALDVGPEPAPTPQAATRTSARGYAERAREALDRYDYEEAQTILREACRAAPADPAPAVALVELLVDVLGDPSAALEHWGALEPGLLGEPRIRGAVAVAAALNGDAELARELLGTLRGERAAEAWAHLARRATAGDDAALAHAAREAIALEAPAHPAIREVDEWVAARAMEARRDAEACLLEAQAAGLAPDALAAMAKDLEQRHPASAVAARVLRAIQAAATCARIEALLASAEEQAPHDDAAAVASWREALSLGADASAFAARLDAAERRLHAERVARAVEEIAATIARDREAALVRALESEQEVREALLARLEPDDAALLSRAAELSGARPKAAARAALAFESATALLERDQHADAARLLDGHAKLLDALPETPALRQRLTEARQREQQSAAALALEAARDALERGELEEAKRALGRVRADGFSDDRAAEHERLLAEIEKAEHMRILEATLELREREGSWLEVAKACEAARERVGPERAAALSDRAARARAKVRDVYRVTTLPLCSSDPHGLPPFGHGSPITSALGEAIGGDRQVSVTGGAGWLIARWVDLARDSVLRVVCLRPPDASPTATPTQIRIHDDRLSIVTSDAVLYTFSLDGAALTDRVDLDPERTNPNEVVLVHGSHYAWQLGVDGQPIAQVFDTRTGQVRKRLTNFHALNSVPGAPLVLRPSASDDGRAFFLDAFDARGAIVAHRVALPAPLYAVCDSDRTTVYVVCERQRSADGPSHVIARCDLSTGTTTTLVELEASHAMEMAYVPTSDAVYVGMVMSDRTILEAYSSERGERRWRVELAYGALAASGLAEDAAYVALPRPGGQRYERLSSEPPSAGAVPILRWDATLDLARRLPLTKAAREVQRRWAPDALPLHQRADLPNIILGLHGADEESTSGQLAALWTSGATRLTDEVLHAIERAAPLGAVLRTWLVKRALDAARWGRARAMLDELEPLVEQPELRSWCRWARGIAAYASGEIERAIEAWTTEADDEHAAECRRLIERVRLLHQGGGAPEDADADAALLRMIRESDQRASAGDLDGAIDALDHHIVWLLHEAQSFGRLAARHLEREPRSAGQWLRKLEVLIEHVMASDEACSMVLAVPGAHWSEERLQAIRTDARRWLDETTPPRE